ncbi:MAG TPA: AAA family ATPase [Acidimicrobiia bacterium]|nr:AAA family ATPase [Acidimicrobiia bacterium]
MTLEHLRVANLGVLEDAAIDPSPGFTVITGETGAGKTLLLGGLRLILGDKSDSGAVGPYREEAQADGLIVVGDSEMGASRVVPRDGRSRAHLDGTLVSAATLQERLGSLVEIVGQHDQLSMTRPARLLDLLDSVLDEQGRACLTAYRESWSSLQDALARRERLGGDQIALARELDLARYQASEISSAQLEPGLDERLEADVSRMRNIEEIREHLAETTRLVESMAEQAGEVVSRLRKAMGLDDTLADLANDADGLAASVTELGREARRAGEGLEFDAAGLEELEARLTAMGDLKRKYGRTLADVVAYGDEVRRRAEELEELIGDADQVDDLVDRCKAEVRARGAALSRARREVADSVAEKMQGHLGDLGLGSARVSLDLREVENGPSGADRVVMEFASDSRLDAGDVASVASGGELSRLVLALRLATRADDTSTLVFDEVDTGIGGKTALAMGAKLAELARASQVLCVTHLPQVAAHADTHFVVERNDDGPAEVRLVQGEDRVTEIARMLAGLPDSEAGRSAAAELLEGARRGA